MSIRAIQDRLNSYGSASAVEEEQALREITQEIVLAALGRTDFFDKAAFQGGTCLRIFHGVNRFSEDLDFALKKPDKTFELRGYFKTVAEDLGAFGYRIELDDRSAADEVVKKAFFKDDSIGRLLKLDYRPKTGPLRKIRIKFEVDSNPPSGAGYEVRVMDFPFPAAVSLFNLRSLFAGKMHALLCREYEKGRDWYDFLWYAGKSVRPNFDLLAAALDQTGPWAGKKPVVHGEWCHGAMSEKIKSMDFSRLREDVRRFLKPVEWASLKLWSREFFLGRAAKLFGGMSSISAEANG
jgi:predicted nucleotidyltransferase component of viral defense system